MINFIESIGSVNPQAYMDGKVEEFWKILNPHNDNGDLNHYSLCKRVERLLTDYNNNNYLQTVLNGDVTANQRHITLLEYLCDNDFFNLKRIVQCKPQEFGSILGEVFSIINTSDLTTVNNGVVTSFSLGKLLSEKVFFYDLFRSQSRCVDFYKGLRLEGKYCLYCNDSELSVIDTKIPTKKNGYRNDEGKLLFDLDHFYLKSRYPFFSLSFYNLIPCCGICNSRFRGTKHFSLGTHINPYFESFDEHYCFVFDEAEITTSVSSGIPNLTSLNVEFRDSSNKSNDRTSLDLSIKDRYMIESKMKKCNNILDTMIKYHSIANQEEMDDLIHGVNEEHLPKSRQKILNVGKAKFGLDFLDMARPLLD